MDEIKKIIENVQEEFNFKINEVVETNSFDKEMYKRFLNMQYHLTKGVQKHFLRLASSEQTYKYKKFRKWLINFGFEEEPHYIIAAKDLENLGYSIDKAPLDIELWWLYFNQHIETRPLSRIGATAVLENISGKASNLTDQMLMSADGFIKPENTVFLKIHRHGPNLDHGTEVLNAIEGCNFGQQEMDDVVRGAEVASTIYLRALSWVIKGSN